jgi:hypothetical protein
MMGRGTGREMGRDRVKGKVLVNDMRQTLTQTANKSGYI